MPLCRASELDRLLKCPGAAWLPRQELVTEKGLEARDWGNACHKWAETGELPTNYKFRTLLLKKIAKSGTNREELWNADGSREMALAYNVIDGRCETAPPDCQDKNAWKGAFGDEWIVGTLDYAQVIFDTPWVDDLKTGRFVEWEDYAAQQTFYCAVYSKLSVGSVVDTRSTITHWPRYPTHKKPYRFGHVLEAEELLAFLRSLKDFRLQVLAQKPQSLVLGDHCKFCPSRGNCPEFGKE